MVTGDAPDEAGAASIGATGEGDVERGINVVDRPHFKDQVQTSTKDRRWQQRQQQAAMRNPPAVAPPAPTNTGSTPVQPSNLPLVSADAVPVETTGVVGDGGREEERCHCECNVKRYKVYWTLSILATALITGAIVTAGFCGAGHCPDSSVVADTANLESTSSPNTSPTETSSPTNANSCNPPCLDIQQPTNVISIGNDVHQFMCLEVYNDLTPLLQIGVECEVAQNRIKYDCGCISPIITAPTPDTNNRGGTSSSASSLFPRRTLTLLATTLFFLRLTLS